MQIQRIDPERPGGLLTAFHDAFAAAYAGVPGPLWSRRRLEVELTEGFPGARAEAWVAVDGGEVLGGYGLAHPVDDNTHLSRLATLVVRPERQRAGVGSALLAHAVERVRAAGRGLVLTETPAEGAGARFAKARGFTFSLGEARRVLDLRRADWDGLRRMLPEPDGYRVERWLGPAGPDLLPDLATVMNGMNDAPRDEGVEAASFSLDRVRQGEERIELTGETTYSVLVRRVADGAPAGYSRIILTGDEPDGWASQADTTVLPAHRGHRLGLLLKLTNLLWLRESEPGVERIITWNARSNAHMLAINEAMGFELLDEWNDWRLDV
ncbi:GNAT family N-acetyltransferase [Nonomuraea sp. SBT364]|uniref:GNAT family N-acetyltransferase n=1 Tax=Nonomuraea sp. SBT364 TaxID=1580530 RepID=UPI00066D14BF|nr:GNAT family N-acetyltransferase [Nonomuraea sp. SBT364]